MDEYAKQLNNAMVNVYNMVSKLEERMLNDLSNMSLSIRELHMLEYISDSKSGHTVSEIAQHAGITPPSATTAVKKLERHGYVEKIKDSCDGRQVNVVLTRLGRKVNSAHKYYHIKMMRRVAAELKREEETALLSGLKKLGDLFENTIEHQETRAAKI